MFDVHSKASVAQIVFYIPAVVLTAHLLFRRHGSPRMAWVILLIFTIIRIACGAVVIAYEAHPRNTGLLIASVILLNAGVFPLIGAIIGLMKIIMTFDFPDDRGLRRGLVFARILLISGVAIIIAGGSLAGKSNDSTSSSLAKTGYTLFAVLATVLLIFQLYIWRRHSKLGSNSLKVLIGISAGMPFFAVRIVYMFLEVYHPSDKRWNELFGNPGLYIVMALMMEYAVVCIYIYTGFCIAPTRKAVS